MAPMSPVAPTASSRSIARLDSVISPGPGQRPSNSCSQSWPRRRVGSCPTSRMASAPSGERGTTSTSGWAAMISASAAGSAAASALAPSMTWIVKTVSAPANSRVIGGLIRTSVLTATTELAIPKVSNPITRACWRRSRRTSRITQCRTANRAAITCLQCRPRRSATPRSGSRRPPARHAERRFGRPRPRVAHRGSRPPPRHRRHMLVAA